MAYETLLLDVADGIARLTVNRPDKLNALNGTVIRELGEAASALDADASVRGVILTGAGPKAFVAGADIGELSDQGPIDGKARAQVGQRVFRQFEQMTKPVIAAVNGFALGGGCELAMACHLRVAAEHAKFGQPEVKLGLGPGYGGTVRLPRLVGRGRALELLLTGAMIDAPEAYRIGLVNRVVPADRLLPETEALLRSMIENAPLALRLVLEAVDAGSGMGLEDALLLEANHFGLASSTEDMREGTSAFLAKRKPAFKGR
ncbi:MAG TPA: enoyl-CoA hydratase-related protein [Gemmatimonadales bacterium]|nr:enoyl-CoA hydratase-related protein [Gemmatimonadales bacterium]